MERKSKASDGKKIMENLILKEAITKRKIIEKYLQNKDSNIL